MKEEQVRFRGERVSDEWIFGYYLEFALCDGKLLLIQ